MKTKTKLTAILLAAALCFCFSGCGGGKEEKQQDKGQKINDILADTPACDGWAPSVVEMINTVFHDYEWEYKQQSGNKDRYIVTFTGTYSPNPDISEYSQSGTIEYIVDIQSNEAIVYSDPNSISSTFLVYIVN